MKDLLTRFAKEDDGAITVDFVVLTAAICTLGFIILAAIGSGTTDLANDIEAFLDNITL